MDLMLISGTEDIDDNQDFFENIYLNNNQYKNRLEYEYELDDWEIYERIEEENEKKNKISDRQRAIRRVSKILENLSSNK